MHPKPEIILSYHLRISKSSQRMKKKNPSKFRLEYANTAQNRKPIILRMLFLRNRIPFSFSKGKIHLLIWVLAFEENKIIERLTSVEGSGDANASGVLGSSQRRVVEISLA